jgi:hypothetical protein
MRGRDVPSCSRERGGVILLVLGGLLSLSLLSALSLFSAHAELMVTLRRQKARESFYAAETGLESALAALNRSRPALLSEEVFLAPWKDPGLPVFREEIAGWTLSWRAFPLPDLDDADGDPSTDIVLFNADFGYHGSPFLAGGYPVFQVNVLAEKGEWRKALVAAVTPVSCRPEIEAAWTSPGEVVLEGPVSLSGRDHDLFGRTIVDPDRSRSAFVTGGGLELIGGAWVEGADGRVVVCDAARVFAATPLAVLNAGASLPDLDRLPSPPAVGEEVEGMVSLSGDYFGPLSGAGLFVVHNPRFLPLPYEASRRAIEEHIFTPDYDPLYSHLDPDNQPALLEIAGGGRFEGLVVADALGTFFGETVIIGGVVTLSRSPRHVRAEVPVEISYSREAIDRAGRGPIGHRLGFKAFSSGSAGFP